MKQRMIILAGSVGLALILSAVLILPLTVLAAGGVTQTSYADFTQSCTALTGTIPSPLLTDTQVTGLAGGAVILAATRIDNFDGSTLNATLWNTEGWVAPNSPYTPTLSSGILTLPGGVAGNGGAVYSVDQYTHGAVEAIAEFGSGASQHIGFGNHRFAGNRYFIFSTLGGDGNLYARVNNSVSEQSTNLGPIPSGFHRYRVEWSAFDASNDRIIFYIDGVEVEQFDVTNTLAVNFHAYLSNDGTANLNVNFAQVEPPYAASGTYTSCAFDAGAGNGWQTINWDEVVTPSTTLAVEARVSSDGSIWSAYQNVSNSGLVNSSTMARYVQYRLLLSTADIQVTPVVNSVALTNDTLPSLAVNNVTVTEGNAGTVEAVFTVSLSLSSTYTATVNYATANHTSNPVAVAPADYLTATGSLTFPPGVTTRTITVTVQSDLLDEDNERFQLNLSGAVNATIGDSQGLGTITDNDNPPNMNINDVAVTEGISGTTTNLVFTVSLTQSSGKTITATYTTANGTASAPTDYITASGTLTFTPGVITQPIAVTVNGDAVFEPSETLQVNLTGVGNATLTDSQGLGTITNDDTAGVSLTQSGGTTDVSESGITDTYQIRLTSQPTDSVTINLNADSQVNTNPVAVIFDSINWSTPQTITVTAVNDLVAEGAHTGVISHTATSNDSNYNGLAISNVTANITDNDTAGVSRAPATIAVTEGGITATYVISLTSQPVSTVTLTISPNAQLSVNPGNMNFTALNWNIPQTIIVTAVNDSNTESSPHTGVITHTVTSADTKYNNIAAAGVTANITDNDAPLYKYVFLPFVIKE